MIYKTFIIYDLISENNVKYIDYIFYPVVYCYFAFLLILLLFFNKPLFSKKIILYSSFTIAAIMFLSFYFPLFILDDDDYICGRVYGFFNTLHPYIILLIILNGIVISHQLKINISGLFSIENNGYYIFINYLLSFLLGLLIYLPLTLVILFITPFITYITNMLCLNKLSSFYFYSYIIWLTFGTYTGLLIDSLIKIHKPTLKIKIFLSLIICLLSTMYYLVLSPYLVYHVNEGTK